MNIIKKTMIAALLALSALGLTTSLSAFADGAGDAAMYCTGCHDGLTVTTAYGSTVGIVGGGARSCPQRTVAEWVTTIDRMNGKGCGVPADLISGIANYLSGSLPHCAFGPAQFINGSLVCPYPPQLCYDSSGVSRYVSGMYPPNPCPTGMSTTPPPTCTDGLPTFDGSAWVCPTTTTSTSTTTSSTTSTTVFRCNPLSPFSYSASPSSLSFTAAQDGPLPPSQLLSVWVSDSNPPVATWSASNIPAWLSITPSGGREGGSTEVIASINTTQLPEGIYTATINFYFDDGCSRLGGRTVTVSFTVEPSTGTTTTSTTSTTQPTVTSTTTTTVSGITCYRPTADGLSYTTEVSYIGYCSSGFAYSPPPSCPDGTLSIIDNHSWLCTAVTNSTTSTTVTTVSTTTTTTGATCAAIGCRGPVEYCIGCHDGLTVNGTVFFGGARICPQRTVAEWISTIDRMNAKGCGVPANMVPVIADYLASIPPIATSSTSTSTISSSTTTSSSSSTTTVATTTTTTLCNTYVNGTTQYPYSGKGSCHGHPDDSSSSGHVVRDQKWCRKHMTHFNSSGNHTHAYPHPVCM